MYSFGTGREIRGEHHAGHIPVNYKSLSNFVSYFAPNQFENNGMFFVFYERFCEFGKTKNGNTT